MKKILELSISWISAVIVIYYFKEACYLRGWLDPRLDDELIISCLKMSFHSYIILVLLIVGEMGKHKNKLN